MKVLALQSFISILFLLTPNFFFLDICDRNEISKTRRQANLLKRKVLSAGSIVGKPQKDKGERCKTFFSE